MVQASKSQDGKADDDTLERSPETRYLERLVVCAYSVAGALGSGETSSISELLMGARGWVRQKACVVGLSLPNV
jgi:hypothetical protein